MTKFVFTAKMLLAAGALALIGTSCSNTGNKAETPAPVAGGDSSAVTSALPNFRYVDYDSILTHYTLAKQLNEESQKMMVTYQAAERQKQNEIQALGSEIERKQQTSAYLSEASFKADVDNFNKKQNAAAQYLAGQQNKIQAQMLASQQRLQDSINNFISDYNAVAGYDAILVRESGLYFKPELNITSEVIEGLNARYKDGEPAK